MKKVFSVGDNCVDPEFMIQGSSEPLKLLPLKLMRINGIIFPVVCDAEDAQIYALIEKNVGEVMPDGRQE